MKTLVCYFRNKPTCSQRIYYMTDKTKSHFDIIVIGGGPSGYAAAMRAIDFGKSVCLIEKNKLGGAGAYNGALASKTMWEFSNSIKNARRNGFSPNFTWEKVSQTVNEALVTWAFNLSFQIKMLKEVSEKACFVYERGIGTLVSPNDVKIIKKNEERTISGDHIILATGSTPRRIPSIDIDEKVILTSDGIFHMEDFPESIVILGAGVIGCEFATIFANFGKTKVHIIDKQDRILPFEDEDMSKLVTDNLEAMGVKVHKNSQLSRMEKKNGKVEFEIQFRDGRKESITVEKALISIGRVPNSRGLGLEALGIEISERGHVVDDDTKTAVHSIHAVGDLSGHIALVNVGELEGRQAIEKIYGENVKKLTYRNISSIMFLEPEVAAVGMNEQEARKNNISHKVVKLDYSTIGRAIAMGKTEGFFKIIVTDDDEMKVLGMRACGAHASSAIQGVSLLIEMDKSIMELDNLIHPHPSIIEGVQECVRMLNGSPIFKSSIFTDKIKCYSWTNGVETPLHVV